MNQALRKEVFNSYRKLWRAARITFKNDDFMWPKAQAEIRTHYENRKSETDEKLIREYIFDATDGAEFMLQQLVQVREKDGRLMQVVEDRHLIPNEELPNRMKDYV